MTVRAALRDVCASLGGHPVLNDVSIDVEAGSFLTLLGPSGSGKTTTLNVFAGFVRHEHGHVYFDDELIDSLSPKRRDVGFVFQNYALFPHMTAGQNVEFPLVARRVDRATRRRLVGEMLELVELSDFGDKPVLQLSGGQQQRVALARALVYRPRLLLLDEPLAALDKNLRQTMQMEIKRIQREIGVTAIAVTHDQSEALTMSDAVAVMREGGVEQVGSPEELFRQPRTRFVAEFVGEANLLEVERGEVIDLGLPIQQRRGTAVLRSHDVGLAELGMEGVRCREAIVEETVYQGTRYQIVVRVDGSGTRLTVAVAPSEAARQMRIGQRVNLVVDPANVHVIEEREDSIASLGANKAGSEI
jgi:putative spermidine/putrescine transport system ATP-binding protein